MSTGVFYLEAINSFIGGKIKTSFLPEEVRDIVLTSFNNQMIFGGAVEKKYTVLQHSWLVGATASDLASLNGENNLHQNTCRLLGMLCEVSRLADFAIDTFKIDGKSYSEDIDFKNRFREDFCEYIAEYAFGIDEFKKKLEVCKENIDSGKKFVNILEMFGVSKIGDFLLGQFLSPTFEEVITSVNRDQFDFEIRQLNKK